MSGTLYHKIDCSPHPSLVGSVDVRLHHTLTLPLR